jgi:hypothetical protein
VRHINPSRIESLPQKGNYLAGNPADDSRFVAVFAHALEF